MSAPEDEGEKPYEPTPKRLEDARKKGEIPRSADLATAAAYGGLLLAASVFGGDIATEVGSRLMTLLDQADSLARLTLSDGGRSAASAMMAGLAAALAPLALIPFMAVLAAFLGQRALLFTPSKLQPKLSRISPLAYVKNRFGRNGLFEFAKSFAKLAIYSVVLGLFLVAQLPELLATLQLSAAPVAAVLARMTLEFLFVVLGIALAIGVVDAFWQHAEHHRKHRMSHKDLTDETKQMESDPHVKQARRQRAYDIATNRMLADVPSADVVIVNPEHYAVALRWNRAPGAAPVCVAKGVDEIAARIRETASAAGVPLRRDPATARGLHASVAIGEEIHREHYAAVAAAIRFAESMRKKRQRHV